MSPAETELMSILEAYPILVVLDAALKYPMEEIMPGDRFVTDTKISFSASDTSCLRPRDLTEFVVLCCSSSIPGDGTS